MKQLIKRALTGAVYVGLIIASMLLMENWLFIFLFAAILGQALNEFYSQIAQAQKNHVKTANTIIDITGGVATFVATAITSLPVAAATFTLYASIRLIVALYARENNPVSSLALGFFGQIYITLPLCALALLYKMGPLVALAMFVFIWASDTGAYCVGCTIGKHRLFERISPKKSWEGFFGGLALCAILGGVAFSQFSEVLTIDSTPLAEHTTMAGFIAFAVAVAIFSTLGDLIESLLKRTIGIKDFGTILPGHGGVLDRIDSLLLVAPTSLICILIINYL